jgi:pimeloyl-ACP methyl ester carboxylesterase
MPHFWQGAFVVTAAFGLLLAAGYFYERAGQLREARLDPAPGKLVDVGGRRLHVLWKGKVGPTVVIEQGAGELARFWWPLQDEIAKFARVCTYDRAGYAWSDDARGARSVDDRVEDLHLVLANGKLPGPYIFVAHSYGGILVRNFAAQYPHEVAGLVLVDTPEERSIFDRNVMAFYAKARILNRVAGLAARFGVLRLLRKWIALDKYGFWLTRDGEFATLCDDLLSFERMPEAKRNSKAAGSLGALPMIVITHGLAFPGPFAVLEKNWSEGQEHLAALSTAGELIVAEKSNHMVHEDEPEVVIDAIRRVHAACRAGDGEPR